MALRWQDLKYGSKAFGNVPGLFHAISKKVRYLFIPAVHPYLVSSCRTALGMSWKSGVAAEVIGIPKASIGEQLYYTKLYLDTSGLFAWTFSIILISAVFEFVFLTLLKKVRH